MWTPDKSVWLAARRDGRDVKISRAELADGEKKEKGKRKRKTGGGSLDGQSL